MQESGGKVHNLRQINELRSRRQDFQALQNCFFRPLFNFTWRTFLKALVVRARSFKVKNRNNIYKDFPLPFHSYKRGSLQILHNSM